MTDPSSSSQPPTDSAYIAHLWDYPNLTIAIFGIQVQTPESYAMYEAAGIPKQMEETLAQVEGLLCVRSFSEANSGLQLQYWRSHEDLARFARQMPHTVWWKWLNNHRGQGFSLYHEIYQCKTAEAVFETGYLPVGPALFCQTSAVTSGEGRSRERQRRFTDATDSS